MRRLATSLTIAAFGLGPVTASAEPSFSCETRSFIIGEVEISGLRVTCSVSGATDDQALRIVSDQAEPVCEATLIDGNGECFGIVRGSPNVGPIVAVLEPSGAQFDVRTHLAVPSAPWQYFPLPEFAGSTDVDEPAADASTD